MKKILLYLILVMAVGMAGIVAYVSIGGLLKVFSGAGTLGLLFFSAIEIVKIVATSAIHTYGKQISWVYKGFLSLGIGIAMVITSIGIYGFLSSTYQETFMKLENVEAQVSLLEKKRDGFQFQLDNVVSEKTSIDGRISDLSKGLSNNVIQYKDPETGQLITTTSSSTRRALEKQLDGAMVRQDALNIKSDGLNDKVYELDNQIVEVRLGNDSAAELGPLKYLSEVTGKSMDEVMKYFIFLLIIIGDPMAVLMVIIFNKIVKKDEDEEKPALPQITPEKPALPQTEKHMLGWEDCMRGKIVRHYGPEVEACVKSVTHGNWKDILKCIVDVKGITNPEVWIPEQLGLFAVWATECLFVDPQTGQLNVKYTEEEVYDEDTQTIPVSNVTSDENIAKIVEQYSKPIEVEEDIVEEAKEEGPIEWVSEEEVIEALQEIDTEDQELLDYAKVDELIAKEYLEDEEEALKPNSNLIEAAERYKEVIEEPKKVGEKVVIEDIKEKRLERARGFSVDIPERKRKIKSNNSVSNILTDNSPRN